MSTLATLVVKLVGDVGGFSSALGHAEKTAKNAGSSIEASLKGGLSAAGVALGTLAGGVLMKGLGLVQQGISGIADAMIGGNAEFERYTTQFTVLLGSSEAAKKRLDELAVFGAKTPFDLPGVVRADKILQSFGLHAEDVSTRFGKTGEEIRTIAGDVAAGTGAGFEEIAGYLGKFSAGATGEAIMRFQELGIVTRQQLTEMGLEFSKSGELLSPLDESMGVLLEAMKGKFGGMMDAQSGTFEGMVSNLGDWLGQTGRLIGAPIFEVLKDKLSGLLTFLGSPEAQGALTGFATGIANAISWLIDSTTKASTTLAPFVQQVITLFQQVVTWVQANFPIVRDAIVGAFEQVKAVAIPIIAFLEATAKEVFGEVAAFAQTNFPIVRDAIVGAFQTVVAIITPIINTISGLATSLIQALTAAFTAAGASIGERLTAIWDAIKSWASSRVAEFIPMFQEWAAGMLTWIRAAIAEIPGRMVAFWEALYAEINKISENIGEKIPEWVAAFVVWIDRDLVPWLKTEFPKIAVVLAALILALPVALVATLAVAALAIVNGLVTGMKTAIETEATRITNLAIAVIDGLIKGFNDAKQKVIDALLSILKGAVDAVKAFFGIASPSKLMMGIGFNIAAGMAQGIMGGSGLVDSAMGALAGVVVPAGATMGRRGEGERGSGASAGSATGGMPMQAVVNVHLDGRLVESFVTDMLYTSLQGAA